MTGPRSHLSGIAECRRDAGTGGCIGFPPGYIYGVMFGELVMETDRGWDTDIIETGCMSLEPTAVPRMEALRWRPST